MKPRPLIITSPAPRIPTAKARLLDPVHLSQPAVSLAAEMNWPSINMTFDCYYSDDQGHPELLTRLLTGLHYLKYANDLIDEATVFQFLGNFYWQYFCCNEYYEYELPCHPSTLSHWRKRLGIKDSEDMLKETIALNRKKSLIDEDKLSRVVVDTTVQEKANSFSADAKLYHKMRQRFIAECRKIDIKLCQTYVRYSPKVLLQHLRYQHQKKARLAKKALKKIKTCLGQVNRDIIKIMSEPSLEMKFLLAQAESNLSRHPKQNRKIYSIHAPEVCCIAKRKSRKKYEFGSIVSIATTTKCCWILAMQSFQGNLYDGYTLSDTLLKIQNLHKI